MEKDEKRLLEKKNAELEIELARKNRELQVEASLEKVRGVAMEMRKPDDLIGVCRVFFGEIQSLGFTELRNALINTDNPDNRSFRNYDYSDLTGNHVVDIPFAGSSVIEKFRQQIKASEDAFYESVVSGEELANWKAFRAANGEFNDPRLDNANTLYYYFYSVGTGSIGISTFRPLNIRELELLKRFRNAFDFAYRRYIDVAQAEERAKEASIEASLERMRAVAMSMRKSEELSDFCEAMFKELTHLGFDNIRNAQIAIEHDETQSYSFYVFSEFEKISGNQIRYDSDSLVQQIRNHLGKTGEGLYEKEFSEDEMEEWRKWRKTIAPLNDREKTGSFCWYMYAIGKGHIGISTFQAISGEQREIVKRFKHVFELSYRRFDDLQKAEAQSRESQIQLALERVRARTMAMQRSSELSEVVYILFQQFRDLGESPDQATIGIVNEDDRVIEYWVTMYGNQINQVFKFSIDEPHVTKKIYDAWKTKQSSLVIDLAGKELEEFTLYRHSMGGAKYNPEEKRRIINVAFFSKGLLNVQSTVSRSGESIRLLERFAAVFEQTYTRFLDLQQAEKQAREAQIEAALERVRSRTMGMQKSSDLGEVLSLLVAQLQGLGFKIDVANFNTEYREKDFILWLWVRGTVLPRIRIPHFDHPYFDTVQDTLAKGLDFNVSVFSREVRDSFREHYQKITGIIPPDDAEKSIKDSNGIAWSLVFFKNTSLMVGNYDAEPYSEEQNAIVRRFGNAFEQAYTRFFDLQKAEAQSREGQIQLALERVRASTMAMQRSDELREVVTTLYEQLQVLNFDTHACNIIIINKATGDREFWIGGYAPKIFPESYKVPYFSHPYVDGLLDAWKRDDKYGVFEYSGKMKQEFDAVFLTQTDFKNVPPDVKRVMIEVESVTFSTAFFNYGVLQALGKGPLSRENADILQRFAQVFEQTYTRFLDLQKAEAQAREGQIEAALERIRSRSMGMQKSGELKEVIQVVYEQFVHINMHVEHTGFIIDYKEKDDMNIWLADEHQVPFRVTVPYFDCASWRSFIEAKQTGKDFFTNHLSFEEKNKFYNDLFDLVPGIGEEAKQFYLSCPGLASSTALLDNVGLYIENFSGTPYTNEENAVLMRFGKVFQQTYTRFLDLEKAEAQAKEAQIEAALERVRARAMAMHKTNELLDVGELLYKELTGLGIRSLSVTYSIMAEDERSADYYGINPVDGRVGENPFVFPHTETAVMREILSAWKKQEPVHSIELDEVATIRHQTYIGEHILDGIIKSKSNIPFSVEAFLQVSPKKAFINTFNFKNGYLFIIGGDRLPVDQQQILLRFTKVFELTYRRFLDLQNAEAQAREAQIEAALERVRSRTLAMQQSEELAETGAVLFRQLILLGIAPNRLYITLIKDEGGEGEFWITDEDGRRVSLAYHANLNDNVSFKKMLDGWLKKRKSLIIDMHDDELQDYFRYLSSINVPFKAGLEQKRRIQHIAYFGNGFIGMASPDEQPPETLELLERFAYVFNLTYTRFNDLKIAEAHASQAEQDLVEIKSARKKAEDALAELQATQRQLIQSEKMASLGELTAGIAHEIQNPLNFVNNFAEVSKELLVELKNAVENNNQDEAAAIAADIIQNLEKIEHHGKRADAIVKGMLQHSRSGSFSQKQPTDINALCDEYIRLCFHGVRARDNSFNATINTAFDDEIGTVNVIRQDIGRVLLNLLSNAFYAVNEKKRANSNGYQPTVTVETKRSGDSLVVTIADNGTGIPQNIVDKIFQPFFTTKPTGQGTGLGLSLAYDIVKAHGGEIKVETKPGDGTGFTIQLPYA